MSTYSENCLVQERLQQLGEGLSEEGLAIFDILTKPEMTLTAKEKEEVKKEI